MREEGYRLGYRPYLDGLRGVAVLLVLVGHALDRGGAGVIGVTLFFVLSGFLITRLLLEEHARTGRVDIRALYIRRVRRLLPAALVFLAFVSWALPQERAAAVLALTNTANFASQAGIKFGLLLHTWSLSMEEQFYLLWPVLALPVARWRWGRWALGGGIIAIGVWRIVLLSSSVPAAAYTYRPDVRADGLVAGCLLALLVDRLSPSVLRVPAALGALGLAVSILPLPPGQAIMWTLSLSTVACAVVVGWASLTTGVGVLSIPPLVWTGRISYGLYLWHYPIVFLARPHGPMKTVAIVLVTSYILAVASWIVIERPFRERSKRETAAYQRRLVHSSKP